MTDPTPHLERFQSYEHSRRDFQWTIPERFNIASAICRRHPDPVGRIALQEIREAGINTYTFGGLDFLSDKFATALSEAGITEGDLVAVLLPQSAALAVAHLGVLKTGAVLVPLPTAADASLLQHAITHGNAKSIVVDESVYDSVQIYLKGTSLGSCFVVRDLRPTNASSNDKDFWTEVDRASSDFEAAQTDANSPAVVSHIQSDGKVSSVVHSHRSLIGQLPSFEMFMQPAAESVFWTPVDWSAANALLGALYPAWWYGCSFVAGQPEDRDGVLRLLERGSVTHAVMESAFMKSYRRDVFGASEPNLHARSDLVLSTVVCDRSDWADYKPNDDPPFVLNDVYGKPETGWLVGRCERWFKTETGSMGRAAPGRSIEVVDEIGVVVSPGETGNIAIHKTDPALCSQSSTTTLNRASCFVGEWFLTGDRGYKNEDGDFFIHHPLT